MAGERDSANHLHVLPALKNAVEEATTRAAAGSPGRGRQAPPLLVAVIIALEGVVVHSDAPLFVWGFAFYRLLRHWCALRWGDTCCL